MSNTQEDPTPGLDERPEPSLTNSDPKRIGERYVVIERLGAGGMGKVYRAHDPVLARDVTVKILRFDDYSDAQLRRFQQEARAIAKLNHPGISKAMDFGVTSAREPFLVLEYIDGEPLNVLLEEKGTLDFAEFISVFGQVAKSMGHAHSQGIVHRDLKPSNILVQDSDGELHAYVLDFGIAKMLHGSESLANTSTGQVVGSPRCISPEQIQGTDIDERSDIYSLGCVMFESLTGKAPFSGDSAMETMQMHLNENAPSLSESGEAKYNDNLEQLICKSLQKAPEQRYQSMEELAKVLDNLTTPDNLQDNDDASATTTKRSKHAVVYMALVACILLIGALSFYRALDDDKPAAHSPEQQQGKEQSADYEYYFGSGVDDPELIDRVESGQAQRQVGSFVVEDRFTLEPYRDKGYLVAKPRVMIDDSDVEQLFKYDKQKVGVLDLKGRFGREVTDAIAPRLRTIPLRKLILDRTLVTDKGLEELMRPTKDNILRDSLDTLSLNKTVITDKGLKHISGLENLRYILVGNTHMTVNGLDVLFQRENLKGINMEGLKLSAEDFEKLSGWKDLELLNLNGTGIGLSGARSISKLKKLNHLSLQSCKNIDDRCIGQIARCQALVKLWLARTAITSKGIKKLAALKHLESLDLSGLQIVNQNLDSIAGLPIDTLILAETHLSKRDLNKLANLKNLKYLTITDYPDSRREVREFQKENPEIVIDKRKIRTPRSKPIDFFDFRSAQ